MKVKEESEKGGLKLNIQKTKIMASRPITSWQIHADTTLIAKSEKEFKNLLKKVKEQSEKTCLKLNIQKTKIIVSCPVTS